MPKLNCGVTTCTYNENDCCCINSINVGGTTATKPSSTSCDSFQHKNSGFTNDIKEGPKTTVSVQCKAHNCVHNKEQECCAGHIDVAGSSANQCDETKCSSFCCK